MSYINEIHIFLAGERLVGYVSRENTGDEKRNITVGRGRLILAHYMAIILITQIKMGL